MVHAAATVLLIKTLTFVPISWRIDTSPGPASAPSLPHLPQTQEVQMITSKVLLWHPPNHQSGPHGFCVPAPILHVPCLNGLCPAEGEHPGQIQWTQQANSHSVLPL